MNKYRCIIFALLCCVLSFAQADENVRIAVLDFKNNTGNTELDPLSKGLSVMLQNALFTKHEFTIIEHTRINQVQNELNHLTQSKSFEQDKAASKGKLLEANYHLTGSYFCHEDNLRIEVQVTKVKTGEIFFATQKEGKGDDLPAIIDALVADIAKNLRSSISQKGQKAKYTFQPGKMQSASMPEMKRSTVDKYSRAWSRRENGDEGAWRKFLAEIEAEDPAFLGFLYYHGDGVEQDCERAKELFQKCALNGEASAQYLMGMYYEEGKCVSQNIEQALLWYRKAAEQGLAEAQYNLGWCHENGEGVQKDMAQAVQWYKKAAEQGNAAAQNNLGWCHENGEGVQKDMAQAVQWYRKAAEQGLAEAQYNLGWCHENGEGVTKDMAQAVQWYRKAAEQGQADAQYNLSRCYYKGEGVLKDRTEGLKWLRMAAEQGHKKALFNLGLHLNGNFKTNALVWGAFLILFFIIAKLYVFLINHIKSKNKKQ